ncbi:MAG: hypothetical protein GX601_12105 [Anaerolineales bacterium]|nr:hypothetical protein [Anaerolineales bacterium]
MPQDAHLGPGRCCLPVLGGAAGLLPAETISQRKPARSETHAQDADHEKEF